MVMVKEFVPFVDIILKLVIPFKSFVDHSRVLKSRPRGEHIHEKLPVTSGGDWLPYLKVPCGGLPLEYGDKIS